VSTTGCGSDVAITSQPKIAAAVDTVSGRADQEQIQKMK
jgi:hypothetical protein